VVGGGVFDGLVDGQNGARGLGGGFDAVEFDERRLPDEGVERVADVVVDHIDSEALSSGCEKKRKTRKEE